MNIPHGFVCSASLWASSPCADNVDELLCIYFLERTNHKKKKILLWFLYHPLLEMLQVWIIYAYAVYKSQGKEFLSSRANKAASAKLECKVAKGRFSISLFLSLFILNQQAKTFTIIQRRLFFLPNCYVTYLLSVLFFFIFILHCMKQTAVWWIDFHERLK